MSNAIILIAILVFIAYLIFRIFKAKKIITQYFTESNIEVERIEFRPRFQVLRAYPSSPFHIFFFVKVKNNKDDIKEAYVRIGDWGLGLIRPNIKIYWKT